MSPIPERTAISLPGLLATDLDGTLAVNGRIGAPERRAANRLRAAGIPLLVITGRNPRSLRRVDGLWEAADEVLFASGAGRLTAANAEPEELHRLAAEDAARISLILDARGEDYCVLDPIPSSHKFAWKRHRPVAENPDFDARMAIYADWGRPWERSDCDDACQVLIIRPSGAPADPKLETALSDWSVFHSSSPIDHASTWLEVFPAGVDKGSALAEWCARRRLPMDRVLALGNDHNDRSMLDRSGHPRVVGNAPGALRSRYSTLPPAGEGGFEAAVEDAIRLFGSPAYRAPVSW